MSQNININDFKQLFLNDTPLLDVRAPVEYNKGAFPNSHNIPLLDDEQRQAIGTCYKEKGQQAAIDLGWQLATPAIKQQRLDAWVEHTKAHPDGYLYCFRGGLRSNLSKQMLKDEAGVDYPLIEGGYKAMRRFLIDELDQNSLSLNMVIIGGRTGSGKTLVINNLKQSVDLEGLAKHRGSAFGRQVQGQPSQIDFENALSIQVMKHLETQQKDAILFCEDESKLIGRLAVPASFLQTMQKSPVVILETSIEERVDITLKSYVEEDLPAYIQLLGEEDGMEAFKGQVLDSVSRIRKKFGEKNHNHLYEAFSNALNELKRTGNPDQFRPGIELLLTQYYDPMYDYQEGKKAERIIFRGTRDEIEDWAKARY